MELTPPLYQRHRLSSLLGKLTSPKYWKSRLSQYNGKNLSYPMCIDEAYSPTISLTPILPTYWEKWLFRNAKNTGSPSLVGKPVFLWVYLRNILYHHINNADSPSLLGKLLPWNVENIASTDLSGKSDYIFMLFLLAETVPSEPSP